MKKLSNEAMIGLFWVGIFVVLILVKVIFFSWSCYHDWAKDEGQYDCPSHVCSDGDSIFAYPDFYSEILNLNKIKKEKIFCRIKCEKRQGDTERGDKEKKIFSVLTFIFVAGLNI